MKHILLAVDMQKDFIDGSLGTAEAQAVVGPAAQKIRAFDGPIFVTQDTHFADYLDTPEGRKLPVPHCIKDTPGWQLDAAIAEALTGKTFRRIEKLSFGDPSLPFLIREAVGEEDFSVELIGLCTDICVIVNALLLKTHFPDKEIIVDPSCCAGVTPATHEAALTVMRQCQITLR